MAHLSTRPQHQVSAIGLCDRVIADTPEALLIAAASRTQEVGQLARKRKQLCQLLIAYTAASVAHGALTPCWKKACVLKPSAWSCPHIRRSPSNGTRIAASTGSSIPHGEQPRVLKVHESTCIKPGQRHRRANHGDDLVSLEVQSGDYLEEFEIERLSDASGRVDP